MPESKNLNPKWLELLQEEWDAPYFQSLQKRLTQTAKLHAVYPPESLRFEALKYFNPADTKVVILGQDPYHRAGQAHGLSFSVPLGQSFPPSLRNIFKELKSDLNLDAPFSGNLRPWAQQGVLLLNSSLSVADGQPGAHLDWGWQKFTDHLIQKLEEAHPNIVFILWGKFAQHKKNLIPIDTHAVIESAHPSPFSAHRGFFGSKPFSKCNELLESFSRSPIQWQLD
jgi:uracil-DNA glycosylase